jgi:hypothetical protein
MNDLLIGAGFAVLLLARKVAFSILVHNVAHFVEGRFGSLFAHSDRKEAIHTHYLDRANGAGHTSRDVSRCTEPTCVKFFAVV